MWAILTYSVLIIFAMPVIAGAVTMLLTDRHFGTHFFDPARRRLGAAVAAPVLVLRAPRGLHHGAAGLRHHLEILPVFARKPIFGYKAIAASTVAIAFLGFLTWAHHMFTAPIPEAILVFVMLSSFLIAVPTGVKMLNWIATLWRGTIEFKTPLLFCVGFIALFVIGGISGVFLAIFPVDWQLNETYFVVAHIHFVLMGGSVFTIFAAIYYWFPKITGRMLSEGLGKLSFYLMFVGFLATFLIQHVMGLDGMPRRVYEYDNVGHLALYNVISTVGSFILGRGRAGDDRQRRAQPQGGRRRRTGPVEGEHAGVVHDLAPPANNFDVIPLVRSAEPMKDIRREIERRTRASCSRRGHRARRRHAGRRVSLARGSASHGPRSVVRNGRLAHNDCPAASRPCRTARTRALAAARRLPRADQAEGPVAAAADDDHDDVRRRRSLAGAVALTCLGGYLSAGGAGAVNHWFDRDIDARMARTAGRSPPGGSPRTPRSPSAVSWPRCRSSSCR